MLLLIARSGYVDPSMSVYVDLGKRKYAEKARARNPSFWVRELPAFSTSTGSETHTLKHVFEAGLNTKTFEDRLQTNKD